jgi:hypothetical protein
VVVGYPPGWLVLGLGLVAARGAAGREALLHKAASVESARPG